MHLTEVRGAEIRMAFFFLKTVTLTGRARRAPPEHRSSAHVGILDCQIFSSGDLNLSRELRRAAAGCGELRRVRASGASGLFSRPNRLELPGYLPNDPEPSRRHKFRACLRSRTVSRSPYTHIFTTSVAQERDPKAAEAPERHPCPRTISSLHCAGTPSCPLFVPPSLQAQVLASFNHCSLSVLVSSREARTRELPDLGRPVLTDKMMSASKRGRERGVLARVAGSAQSN